MKFGINTTRVVLEMANFTATHAITSTNCEIIVVVVMATCVQISTDT